MKKLITLILLCISFLTNAQDLTGIWQGYITAKGLLNRSEYTLHVKNQNNGIITGKAYLYSNQHFIFHGIFDFIGKINPDRSIKITELRILTKEMPDEKFGLCMKYENIKYSRDTAEHLTGDWGNTKGNCPPGEVYLQKIPTNKLSNPPVPDAVITKIKEDKEKDIPFLGTVLAKPIILDVRQVTLKITLKDYLKEDFDTVSVYFNRREIIKDHLISNKPFTTKIKLDILSGPNEVIIYAKNLGRIPPNTCTLIVDDGLSRQKVSIVSDKQSSAAIYLNYTLAPGVLYKSVDDVSELDTKPANTVIGTVIK